MREFSGVVGLDLSLTSAGIVRISKRERYGDEYIEAYGTKVEDGSRLERYHLTMQKIMSVVDKDDLVLIEDFAFGIGPDRSSLATLGELSGIVKYVLWRKTGREPVTVSPGTLKKWVSGKGNIKKDEIKLCAYKKWGKEFRTTDEADAYSLADFGWHCAKFPSRRKLKTWEMDMVEKFRIKASRFLHL